MGLFILGTVIRCRKSGSVKSALRSLHNALIPCFNRLDASLLREPDILFMDNLDITEDLINLFQ